MITALLTVVVAGTIVYSVFTIMAARDYLAQRPATSNEAPPISVLKPLAGAEENLEANLRSFFVQDYPAFEILFAVREAHDPAVSVVRKLQAEYPGAATQLLFTGEPPYPNAKVFSLGRMKSAAQFDILVMSDSDIRVTPGMLRRVADEFADPAVGLATCPYRAVPGVSLWSRLEALGMNTQFLGGVLVARMLEGMKFALGPTIVARKTVLDQMGGFDRLKDYLAEDFVMGKFAGELGHGVILSSYVIEHHIGSHDLRTNVEHRLRWARSTRRSRPNGYLGELFTMPLPPALLLWLWQPAMWPVAAGAIMLRAASAWACAGWVLRDPLVRAWWWLVPLQDMVAFAVWITGFFGDTILWRGRRYLLKSDGRFELLP